MKALFNTTVCALSLIACNNNSTVSNVETVPVISDSEQPATKSADTGKTDFPLADTAQSQPETDNEIKARIEQACRSIPDYTGPQKRLSLDKGLTLKLRSLYRDALAVPTDEPGGIGSEEFLYYWLHTTQDANPATDGIKKVTIDSRTPDRILAYVTFSNCDDISHHKVTLIKQDDKWMIDDFDNMKRKMSDYINRQYRFFSSGEYLNHEFDFLSEAEVRAYQREVDSFLRRHKKR